MAETKKAPNLRFKEFTDDWEQRKLGKLSKIVRGASPRPIKDPKWFDSSSSIGWIRISDVTQQNGRIYHLKQHISKLGQQKTRVVVCPHLLLSIAASVGFPVINYIPTGVHDGFLIFEQPKFNIDFMFYWLENFRPKWNKYGQPGSQVNLNSHIVEQTYVKLPDKLEQKAVSSLLNKLEKIIALQQRKLNKLNLLRNSLLQKLFADDNSLNPELRFKEFHINWDMKKIGSLFTERKDKSADGQLLSVSITKGVYPFDPTERKNNSSANKSNYKLVEKGDIAYNSMRMWQGSEGVSNYTGIVSPAYTVLCPQDGINSEFFAYMFKRADMLNKFKRYSQGLTSDTWNLKFPIIRTINVKSTTTAEQEKIVKLFKAVESTLKLQTKKLERYQQIKKFLLQQMFI